MLPERVLNIVRLVDSARYTILYCGYMLLLFFPLRSSPYALLVSTVLCFLGISQCYISRLSGQRVNLADLDLVHSYV